MWYCMICLIPYTTLLHCYNGVMVEKYAVFMTAADDNFVPFIRGDTHLATTVS